MNKPITDLLTYREIPVSSSYVEQLIASHPDYPSLLSIVDTFNRLGIPNIAAKIEREQLTELEFPYVLQLKRQKDLILIKSARDLEKNKERLEDWEGVVLHVEPTKKINDPENNRLYKRKRFFSFLGYAAALALFVPFVWSTYTSTSAITIGIWLAAICGLVVGYLLVGKDIGVKFDAVENFCTPTLMRNDCDEVLKSEGASIGFVKLSDLVFIYFLCQVCCLASLAIVPAWYVSVAQTLGVLSMISIPMVIYSVAYQFKVSTWCKLCLIVDGILVVQASLFALESNALLNSPVHPTVVFAIAAGSLIIAAIVLLFKSQQEDILSLQKTASDNARTKNSSVVFTHLSSQEDQQVSFNSEYRLLTGNKNAPLKFVMAGNLYCKPCGTQHEKVEQLASLYPELVSVEYRFIRARDDGQTPNSNQYIIEYWLRNIRGSENETQLIQQLMTDWYDLMDLEKFRGKYPLNNEMPSELCKNIEASHIDWALRQDILRTPTFYLNGLKLPKEYWPADLSVMIPTLATLAQAKEAMKKVSV